MPPLRIACWLAAAWRGLGFRVLAALARPGPEPLERLGSAYGGWHVPAAHLGPDAVVYSAGVGEDVSFDEALHRRFGCAVHGFDPTPRARAHVEARRPPGFTLHPWGLWREDGTVRFYAPADPAHVSHSITNLQGTAAWFEAPVRTVRSAMAALGHDHLDLLKMDVEGAEHAVIAELVAGPVRPRVLCVELHGGLLRNLATLRTLRRAGYALRHVEAPNVVLVHAAPGVAPGVPPPPTSAQI